MTEYQKKVLAHLDTWETFVDFIPAGEEEERIKFLVNQFCDVTCKHPKTITVWKPMANGRPIYRKQCADCLDILGSAIAQTPEVKAEAVPEIQNDYRVISDKRFEVRRMIYERIQSKKSSAWWKIYAVYLESPEWQAKRLKVFKRANWLCEGCGEARATEVHHLTYDHAEHEYLFELVALCHKCHDEITNAQRPGAR